MTTLYAPVRVPRGALAALGAAISATILSTLPAPAPLATIADGSAAGASAVIVQGATTIAARAAVEAAGGRVTRELDIIDGVAAAVPTRRLPDVAQAAGVHAVTPDAAMHVQSTPDAHAASAPVDADPVSVYRRVVRAHRLADRGATGYGVTVALLDTGITASPDLEGRVVPVTDMWGATAECVNLSGEPTCADGYGHGTFLAGLIAGSGVSSDGAYAGVAPDADLVSIKVGASDGSADVSSVLAGIQWAVSFKDEYDIRVLNLSLGTNSTQSWDVDPINYAVERAWNAGIVVVVAASNRGPEAGTIAKPGDDPWVITVGATDDSETVKLGDDLLPDFSARGPTVDGIAKPDVVAPGAHLVSLRAVGSAIDEEFPNVVDDTYRRGSGTSMATAVVSGVSAAVLSARPKWGPKRLKYALADTARPVAVDSPDAVGRGMVNAYGATFRASPGRANQGLDRSTGLGDLDASRGTVRVSVDGGGTVLAGLQTAQLLTWDPIGYTTGDWTEETWWLSTWYLLPWFPTTWYGDNWEGDNWEGCSGYRAPQGDCSYGRGFMGSAWYGAWD